jgi:predicted transcriptional regulator YdeE
MTYHGIKLTFNCKNHGQYTNIPIFFKVMQAAHPNTKLLGVGYSWKGSSFEYLIGNPEHSWFNIEEVKRDLPKAELHTVELPDVGWETHKGLTRQLQDMYEKIWDMGDVKYEIEEFFEDGTCIILIHRGDN